MKNPARERAFRIGYHNPENTGGVVIFDGIRYTIYRDLQGIFETFCHVFISFLGCLSKNEKNNREIKINTSDFFT